MQRYEVDVIETVAISRTYIVEAQSEGEARARAERGETVEEWDNARYGEVLNRDVFDIEAARFDDTNH